MIYYVTAKDVDTAKTAVAKLQAENLSQCFITPLTAICGLGSVNISSKDKNALRLDLLTVCDALVVVSDVTEEMKSEINLATLINMEVIYLDE